MRKVSGKIFQPLLNLLISIFATVYFINIFINQFRENLISKHNGILRITININ